MSQFIINSSTGGGGESVTIAGDIGSISGSSLTVYTNRATRASGRTVLFTNSSTTSTLSLEDANRNITIGNLSGNASMGSDNVCLGHATLNLNTGDNNTLVGSYVMDGTGGGSNNCLFGFQTGLNVSNGTGNSCFGYANLNNSTGSYNTTLGYFCAQNYTSSESSNILIQNAGVVGESNVLRIGTQGSSNAQINKAYIAGMYNTSVVTDSRALIIDSNGQIGTDSTTVTGNVTNKCASVDFKVSGSTLLFTPTARFVITSITLYAVNIVGSVDLSLATTIGTNSPNYDNIVETGIGIGFPRNTNESSTLSDSQISAIPTIAAGTGVYINVVTPDGTATTNIQKVYINGFYL